MSRDGESWADPRGGTALGASRGRVLEILHAAGRPLGSAEIARQTGLHPNTVRFHLDGLSAAGLVTRTVEQRDLPGRPRAMYTSVADDAPAGRRSYRLLAEILSSYLATRKGDPQADAVGAGEAWARSWMEGVGAGRTGDTAAARILVDTLDEMGFAPELTGRAQRRQVLLRQCPFRELAQQHRDVVCGIHLGLMRGVLTSLGSSLRADSLEPFVEPHLCIASLVKAAPVPARTPRQRPADD